MTAEQAWRPDVQHLPPAGETTAVLDALGLPHIFSPVEAAQLLRNAGLAEITECALKTRAYRKQVPFHLNGRRIVFTLDDLREIAEGEACRPQPPAPAATDLPSPQPARARRSSPRRAQAPADVWRARRPGDVASRTPPIGDDRRAR
jgi:hypothetical protein